MGDELHRRIDWRRPMGMQGVAGRRSMISTWESAPTANGKMPQSLQNAAGEYQPRRLSASNAGPASPSFGLKRASTVFDGSNESIGLAHRIVPGTSNPLYCDTVLSSSKRPLAGNDRSANFSRASAVSSSGAAKSTSTPFLSTGVSGRTLFGASPRVSSLFELCRAQVIKYMHYVVTLKGLPEDLVLDLLKEAMPKPGSVVPPYLFSRYAECFPLLSALDLRHRSNLDWDRLAAMQSSLVYLALDNVGLDAAQLIWLVRCPTLRWLSMANNHLEDLANFTRPYCDSAQRGQLCRLDHLDVSHNILTDRSAQLLLPLRIGTLVLTGNPISRESLARAREMGYRVSLQLVESPVVAPHARYRTEMAIQPEGWPAQASDIMVQRAHDALAQQLFDSLLRHSDAQLPPKRPPTFQRIILQAPAVANAKPPEPTFTAPGSSVPRRSGSALILKPPKRPLQDPLSWEELGIKRLFSE